MNRWLFLCNFASTVRTTLPTRTASQGASFALIDLPYEPFIFTPDMYTKPVTTIGQQIQQLKDRGLAINDEQLAMHFLSNISYYRLAGYWWPMQSDKVNHLFKANSRFEDVISLYNFDRELRILFFDVIERIEIALRTRLIYHLSHEHGFWWFQKTEIFIDVRELIVTLANLEGELERSKDIFIKEHKKKHPDDRRFPPCIKTLEIATFGSLSL